MLGFDPIPRSLPGIWHGCSLRVDMAVVNIIAWLFNIRRVHYCSFVVLDMLSLDMDWMDCTHVDIALLLTMNIDFNF